MPMPTSLRAERLRARAQQQMAAGQLRAAQATLDALLLRAPQDLSVRLDLARLLMRSGHWRASIQPLSVLPNTASAAQPELAVELVKALLTRGEVVQARSWLDAIARMPEVSAAVWRALAGLRAMLGEVDTAKELIERALAGGANDCATHHVHGLVLKFVGDLASARKEFKYCLENWPQDANSAIELAGLASGDPDRMLLAHADQVLRRLGGVRQTPATEYLEAGFDYVRFRILDALDRRGEAWAALQACNTRMHALRPYPAQSVESATNALMHFSVVKSDTVTIPAEAASVPVFIVGMPRSGTTLLEHMLSAHSQVACAGEINDFETQLRVLADVAPGHPDALAAAIERAGDIDFAELGARYMAQTRWRAHGRRFLVDKLPQNLRMVGFIHRALPQARIVRIVRDPMDVCFSNLSMMFMRGGAYSFAIDTVSHYYRQYECLANYWRETLPEAMLEVAYADLVTDPTATLRRIFTYLGLEMEDGCLHPECNTSPVQSPSSVQVRAPVGTKRIGRWRRYAKPLQALADELVRGRLGK